MSESYVIDGMPTLRTEADKPHGVVVVLMEAFGLTTYIGDVCDRLAAAGYIAIAPDLYHRHSSSVFGYDERETVMTAMATLQVDEVLADVNAVLGSEAVRDFPTNRTGALGFCLGGSFSFHLATTGLVGATVSFYGGGIATPRFGMPSLLDQAGEVITPWLGLYGTDDPSIPIDEVEQLRAALGNNPIPTDVVLYAAGHGFHCHGRPEHFRADAAADGEAMALEWFSTHLQR